LSLPFDDGGREPSAGGALPPPSRPEVAAANDDAPVAPSPDGQGDLTCSLPSTATLDDLFRHLSAIEAPSPKVIQQRSAIRTAGRAIGMPLDEIALDPVVLGPLLANCAPAQTGLTPARLRQIRSLVRGAMIDAGVPVIQGRSNTSFSPAWQALHGAITSTKIRIGTSRLVRHLSAKAIAPDKVNVADLEAFRETLLAQGLHREPGKALAVIVRQWNAAVASVAGWPNVTFPRRPDPRRYALAVEVFPTSFIVDMNAYLTAREDPDPFSEDWCRPARPATLDARRKQILQLATAAVKSGLPVESVTSLAVLADRTNAEAALRWLRDRKGGNSQHLAQQALLLAAIARHWVKMAPEHYRQLRTIAERLQVKKKGMSEKNQARMRQFDLPENVGALLTLPGAVLKRAQKIKDPDETVARDVMLAVAIEILLMAPIRLKNLTNLEIGKHLVEIRRGAHHNRHIVLTEADVKNEQPFDIELPGESCALIDAYLQTYRGRLCPPGSTGLFPNEEGELRNQVAFGRAISNFVWREAGLKLTPQLSALAGLLAGANRGKRMVVR
jgi:hypothetical protein